jgi:ubiquinone biosynthesis accessory factor UbiJ
MNNTPPFSFLESIASRFQPPVWVVDEGQQRLVLFLNHVLMQEKAAQDRLVRQKGRVVHVKWGLFAIDLIVTAAGLVDRAAPASKPDLLLSLAPESPLVVVQAVLAGKPPPLKIEGDVQLAADLGWLAENLRWDAEEDLSRLIGDAPAHALADVGRRLLTGLKQFLVKAPLATGSVSSAAASPASGRSAGPTPAGSAPLPGERGNATPEAHAATSAGASSADRPPLGGTAPLPGERGSVTPEVREATSVEANPPKASE